MDGSTIGDVGGRAAVDGEDEELGMDMDELLAERASPHAAASAVRESIPKPLARDAVPQPMARDALIFLVFSASGLDWMGALEVRRRPSVEKRKTPQTNAFHAFACGIVIVRLGVDLVALAPVAHATLHIHIINASNAQRKTQKPKPPHHHIKLLLPTEN